MLVGKTFISHAFSRSRGLNGDNDCNMVYRVVMYRPGFVVYERSMRINKHCTLPDDKIWRPETHYGLDRLPICCTSLVAIHWPHDVTYKVNSSHEYSASVNPNLVTDLYLPSWCHIKCIKLLCVPIYFVRGVGAVELETPNRYHHTPKPNRE